MDELGIGHIAQGEAVIEQHLDRPVAKAHCIVSGSHDTHMLTIPGGPAVVGGPVGKGEGHGRGFDPPEDIGRVVLVQRAEIAQHVAQAIPLHEGVGPDTQDRPNLAIAGGEAVVANEIGPVGARKGQHLGDQLPRSLEGIEHQIRMVTGKIALVIGKGIARRHPIPIHLRRYGIVARTAHDDVAHPLAKAECVVACKGKRCSPQAFDRGIGYLAQHIGFVEAQHTPIPEAQHLTIAGDKAVAAAAKDRGHVAVARDDGVVPVAPPVRYQHDRSGD